MVERVGGNRPRFSLAPAGTPATLCVETSGGTLEAERGKSALLLRVVKEASQRNTR